MNERQAVRESQLTGICSEFAALRLSGLDADERLGVWRGIDGPGVSPRLRISGNKLLLPETSQPSLPSQQSQHSSDITGLILDMRLCEIDLSYQAMFSPLILQPNFRSCTAALPSLVLQAFVPLSESNTLPRR